MKKSNKSIIAKSILAFIGVAGIFVVAATAPRLFVALGQYKRLKSYNRQQIKRSFSNLKKRGYIGVAYKNGKTEFTLTKEGKEKLVSFNLEEMKIQKPKRWDKQWRIVVFDIPEEFKLNRKVFREKLIELGFKMIQKSVWVCPYPCEDEIDFLKEIYEIRPFVRVITAGKIDIFSDLVKKFNLG